MKHHLRSDKTCLNCGAEVQDRYCSHCGQENLEPKENIGHLIGHFFSDLTHYDSKFFLTIKYLFLRPGFLTREYFLGRRARYINPVRMYFFVSFVFFLIYFSLANKKDIGFSPNKTRDTIHIGNINIVSPDVASHYKSVHEYDSIQKKLPIDERHNAISQLSIRHYLEMRKKYGEHTREVFIENILHNLPKIMFLFLPLFALFLKWMYDKKKYVYVDHAIFSIHFHAFAFIMFLVITIVSSFISIPYWLVIGGLFIYLLLALRNAYEQTFLRTLLKALLISILYSFVVFIGVLSLFLITFFFT